jgi:hypothetical protein
MNVRFVSPSIREFKIRAAILLKEARAGHARAIARFKILDTAPAALRLKHALAVIASEEGFASWNILKRSYDTERFFNRPNGGFLNRWFKAYEIGAI